nr:coiled coil domain containing protein 135 [Hymenolepis microstoma]
MEESSVKEFDLTEPIKELSINENIDSSLSTKTNSEITVKNYILKQTLKEINPFHLPHEFISLPRTFDSDDFNFPSSYRDNTDKEDCLLSYADNFKRQYIKRFPQRTPLFLTPRNELDVRKFVCTTIRPTKLPFAALHDASGVASFIADFLQISPLLPCNELPQRLMSPSTTLSLQAGTCFDYTTLICSLLIGVGYSAYVVSGYATRECCLKDESRKECPILVEKSKEIEMYHPPPVRKYQIKPMKDFVSKYEMSMKMRELIELKEAEEKKKKEEREQRDKDEEPFPDPLYGLRVHSWILVLPGSRDVKEAFFIEPFTGEMVDLKTNMYLGIEAAWNDKNFWVNLQDCTNGIGNMRYDLNKLEDWEFLLPFDFMTEEQISKLDDRVPLLEVPVSWTLPISLTNVQYDQRYPNYQKSVIYNRVRLTKYSPYSQKANLITKITIFNDRDLKDPTEEREYFDCRKDKLLSRITDLKRGWIKESFDHGRMNDQLKGHSYFINGCEVDDTRIMEFYPKLRIDGLVKHERDGPIMKEWFENRDDRLIYRETRFGRTVRKFGPPVIVQSGSQRESVNESKTTKTSYREIEIIKERFSRNPDIPADEDIEERCFDIIGGKYHLKYHIADEFIFPCRREFNKPILSDDARQIIELQSDTHTVFYPKLNPPHKTNAEIYQMLLELIKLEKNAKESVRASEAEAKSILNLRASEESYPELEVGLWDTLRNEEMHKLRIELENYAKMELKRKKETELDYLTPYLDMLDLDEDNLTAEDAKALCNACEDDLQQRLSRQGAKLQTRYDAEKKDFQEKRKSIESNQTNLTKDEEAEYLKYCHDTLVRLNTLENLIKVHTETTPEKLSSLQNKLRSDPRLSRTFENTTQEQVGF